MASAERSQLCDFVRKHYGLTEEGHVVFCCKCVNPENCSEWQHHPDIDAVIVEYFASTTEVEDLLIDFKELCSVLFWPIWMCVTLLWGVECWMLYMEQDYKGPFWFRFLHPRFLVDVGFLLINVIGFVIIYFRRISPSNRREKMG